MNSNKKTLSVIIHIAAWACLFSIPFFFAPRPYDEGLINKRLIVHYICTDVFLLLFYYFNTLFLIPKLLVTKQWGWYVLSILACFFIFLYVPREIANMINGTDEIFTKAELMAHRGGGQPPCPCPGQKPPDFPKFKRNKFAPFSSYTAIFFLVYTIGTCISVVQRLFKTDQDRKEIQNEKLNTELSFLKSQVNPHFFFNTLNNIYSLAVVQSDKTAPAVMKLSSIMRYILTETQTDLVPMENEINFLKNFIDLQQVRLTDKVQVNFTVEGNYAEKQVAPLLFIPFVENAFKYGVSTKEHSTITIALYADEHKITLSVVNTIKKGDNGIHDTTGIGINNVKRRLELLYPHTHTLTTKEADNTFTVHLEILTV